MIKQQNQKRFYFRSRMTYMLRFKSQKLCKFNIESFFISTLAQFLTDNFLK